MIQPDDSTQQRWQAFLRNILKAPSLQRTMDIKHNASAIRSAVRDAKCEARKQENILETAKKVDELVYSPTTMQHWRQKIDSTFKRPEVRNVKNYRDVDNVWLKLLNNLNPDTHIDVLYTLLAFCHDDWLRMNRIVTDELKKQSPLLCESPNICVYHRMGIPQVLDVFLSHVKKDIEVKTELANLKPAEKEQNTPPANIINIGVLGDVRAENVQTGDYSPIHKQPTAAENKKEILKRIPYWIYYILGALSALLTCIYLLWWLWTKFSAPK